MSKTTQENKAKKAKLANVEVPQEDGRQATTDQESIASSDSQPKDSTVDQQAAEEQPNEAKQRTAKVRSKKYQQAKNKIDVHKYYPLDEAVKLVKETSLARFDSKIEAHVNTVDIGNLGEISFPHLETASRKIVVLNDTILAEIKAGQINFDLLIATPVTMPKLLPFARLLGPKGLMPNPKTGTLTDKPEEAVNKLSAAKTIIKTEKKAPVVHLLVGKVSQPEKEIAANVAELIKVIKPAKIRKLSLCATMGPSVKVNVES
jgi:large subunit ribosomal protein L1